MTEKDNQISELEFQLRYITRLNNCENYETDKKIPSAYLPVAMLEKINQEKNLQKERIENIDLKSFKPPLTLNFKWLYLLFGIPFFIDLYRISHKLKRYTKDLIMLFFDYKKDLVEYQRTFEYRENTSNKSVDYMQNEDIDLNESEIKYNTDKDISQYKDLSGYTSVTTNDIKTDDSFVSDGNDYDNKFGSDQYKNSLIRKDNHIKELKVKLEYVVKSYEQER